MATSSPVPRLVVTAALPFLPCPSSPAVVAAVLVLVLVFCSGDCKDMRFEGFGAAAVGREMVAAVRYASGTTSISKKSKQEELRNVACGSEALYGGAGGSKDMFLL